MLAANTSRHVAISIISDNSSITSICSTTPDLQFPRKPHLAPFASLSLSSLDIDLLRHDINNIPFRFPHHPPLLTSAIEPRTQTSRMADAATPSNMAALTLATELAK
jgi:hypothetical protein